MEDYLGTYKNRPRTVVFYGRVSTEHEQQISALGNQMEWYANLAERNRQHTMRRLAMFTIGSIRPLLLRRTRSKLFGRYLKCTRMV